MPAPDPQRDDTELVILAILADEPLYGYAITKHVAARSRGDLKLSPGVLYPLLAVMERQGLITSTWETVRSDRRAADDGGDDAGGRRRKWYRLSAKGRRRLSQRIEAHRAYMSMIDSFLAGPRAAEERAQ
jgi:DNA-binding PadR family transcriptional regulator